MKISFATPGLPEDGALAVFAAKNSKLLGAAAELDKTTKGALTRAIKASRFEGKPKQVLEVLAPPGLKNSRVVLLGLPPSSGPGSRDGSRLAEPDPGHGLKLHAGQGP